MTLRKHIKGCICYVLITILFNLMVATVAAALWRIRRLEFRELIFVILTICVLKVLMDGLKRIAFSHKRFVSVADVDNFFSTSLATDIDIRAKGILVVLFRFMSQFVWSFTFLFDDTLWPGAATKLEALFHDSQLSMVIFYSLPSFMSVQGLDAAYFFSQVIHKTPNVQLMLIILLVCQVLLTIVTGCLTFDYDLTRRPDKCKKALEQNAANN